MIDDYLKGWLIKANKDIINIELILNSNSISILTDIVCFHSQQAVEKLLKSYLVLHNVEFERSHNLQYLQDLCARHDSIFKEFDFQILSNYSINIRYAEDFSTPSEKEALDSYKIAINVKDFVFKKLNVTEDDLKL